MSTGRLRAIVAFALRPVRRLALYAGYVISPRARIDTWALAVHLRDMFTQLDTRLVLDVGANVGLFGRFLRRSVGYTGRIASFEPVPSLVERLRAAAAGDARWEVHPFALGSATDERAINIMRVSEFSSFLSPDHSVVREFQDMNVVARRESVLIKRLDDVLPGVVGTVDLSRVFVKLDTQGYDLQVVEGGRQMLPRVGALQLEVSVLPIYAGAPDMLHTLDTVRGLGLDITGMFPGSRDHRLRDGEFAHVD